MENTGTEPSTSPQPRSDGPEISRVREENLLVVVAVEEYSRRHGISAHETLGLFQKYGIIDSIRQCYETLHTQDIYECVEFAEDILKRKTA